MTMNPDDIKQIGTKRKDLKKAFLLEMEDQEEHIDPDLLNATLNSFVYTDESEGAFLALRNWIMYTNRINDDVEVPYIPINASKKEKAQIIVDYDYHLGKKAKMPDSILNAMQDEAKKQAAEFVKTDSSTDLYELIKEWEVQTFNTYTIDKKQNVIQFVRQYKFK